jgi:hypothetical protein
MWRDANPGEVASEEGDVAVTVIEVNKHED